MLKIKDNVNLKCDICKKLIETDLIGTPVCEVVCLDCAKKQGKLYRGKVADEDEIVIGFLKDKEHIYQMCENRTSFVCGWGIFRVIPESVEEVDLETYLIELGRLLDDSKQQVRDLMKRTQIKMD